MKTHENTRDGVICVRLYYMNLSNFSQTDTSQSTDLPKKRRTSTSAR